AGRTSAMRIACGVHVWGVFRGPGPRGDVYQLDKTQGTEVLCWTSPIGQSSWTQLTVAAPDPATPKAANWIFVMLEGDTPYTMDVATLRDSKWEPQALFAAGRPSSDKVVTRTISVTGGSPLISDPVEEDYPDMTGMSENLTQKRCAPGRCGYLWTGTRWMNCGGCSSGTCNHGYCESNPCTPRPASEVCKNDEDTDAAPCGQRYDGCNLLINCGTCPTGYVCGGEGDYLHCGKTIQARTPDTLRAAYQDTLHQLCGTLDDPATGVPVVLGLTCPDPAQHCVANL